MLRIVGETNLSKNVDNKFELWSDDSNLDFSSFTTWNECVEAVNRDEFKAKTFEFNCNTGNNCIQMCKDDYNNNMRKDSSEIDCHKTQSDSK